jgi:serine/threonine-protein kinase
MERGKPISHYELAEKLGEGGMGEVYRAWDRHLQRSVALKFLRPFLCESAEQVARFRQEARVVAALNHPNIATIHEIDQADGRYFLTFEYLPGGTLKAALDQLKKAGQQISLEQGLDYALQLAEALGYAHSQGVVHRDIKTANVMFTDSGTLKLTDFGLARSGEGSDATQPGTVMGTPATMSPEQARGRETDERSDVFSLGVVLFELFSGKPPFKGENPAAVMYQVVHEAAPPLSDVCPATPAELEQIVAKALRKNPAERYQNAASMASDLRALKRDLLLGNSGRTTLETVVMSGSSATPVESGWWRRCSRRKRTAAAAGSGIAALALVVWLVWPASQTRLAILPFDASADKQSQAAVDGFRELLTSELTSVERPRGSGLMVLPAEDGKDQRIGSPADAQSRLGADLVLTGKLIQTGEQPRLIVSLHDPARMEELRSVGIDVATAESQAALTKVLRMLDPGLRSRVKLSLSNRDSSNSQAVRSYIEGRGFLINSKLDEAEAAFRDATIRDPQYALAWAGLADALFQKYHALRNGALLDEAAQQASRALSINGRVADVHVVMAKILLDQEIPDRAENELQAALKLEPANAHIYQALAALYKVQNDYAKAEAAYRQAIEMRPGDANTYNLLGDLYYQQKKPELLPQAAMQFLQAIRLAPDNFKAHYDLGAVYFAMERYQDAVEQFQKSLFIAPSVSGHSNLGTAYYYAGHYEEAAEEYRKATEQPGVSYKYWGNLADAYRWAGHEEQAASTYRKAIDLLRQETRIDPALKNATLAMYHVSIRHNAMLFTEDRNEALKEIREARAPEAHRTDTPEPDVLFREVVVYAQLGISGQAFEALEKIQNTAPVKLREIQRSPALKDFRMDPRFSQITGNGREAQRKR